jgi:hypothetical protein
MTMRGEIEFNNATDAKRFHRSLENKTGRLFPSRNRTRGYKISSEQNGKKVTFEFHK